MTEGVASCSQKIPVDGKPWLGVSAVFCEQLDSTERSKGVTPGMSLHWLQLQGAERSAGKAWMGTERNSQMER